MCHEFVKHYFKDNPGKACRNGVDNNDAIVNVGNKYMKKNIAYEVIIQENQISDMFRNFPVYEQH